jgi:hypothetical protein
MFYAFQRTARRYITEDKTPHNNRCENLLSFLNVLFLISENATSRQYFSLRLCKTNGGGTH